MNKIIVGFILVMFGCADFQLQNVNQDKLDAVLALNGEEQKLAYNTLSENEKLILWNQKFESLTKNNNFSVDEKKLIHQLMEFNNSKGSMSKSDLKRFEESWLIEAQKLFEAKEIMAIAYQLTTNIENFGGKSGRISWENPIDDDGTKTCFCNKGSVFSCDNPTYYCPEAQSSCKSPSDFGCGFMFLHPCNGVCKVGSD